MAKRDRREVESRLVILLYCPQVGASARGPSRSWQASIVEQRQELRRLAARGVLRNHANPCSPRSIATQSSVRPSKPASAAEARRSVEYSVEDLLSFETSAADEP